MSEIDDEMAMFGESFSMRGPDGTRIPLVRAEIARAATARAERAEAGEADLRATVERVRALAHHWADLPGSEFPFAEAADTLTAALDYIEPAKGAPGVICGPCSLGRHGDCDWDEQTPPQRCHCACLALAALDGTDG